jgi:hypothetical protein
MIGYRAWAWIDSTSLGSISWPESWEPGINMARCQGYVHSAPKEDCDCGFWLKYHLEDVLLYVPDNTVFVFGAVNAWGRIVEHSDGFRCQYAQVIALHNEVGVKSHRLRAPRASYGNQDDMPEIQYWRRSDGFDLRRLTERFDVPLFDSAVEMIKFADQHRSSQPPSDRSSDKPSGQPNSQPNWLSWMKLE